MMGLLDDLLPDALPQAILGRPLRAPLALVHAGPPPYTPDKRLLFLAESGAAHPFAVVKWARGACTAALQYEHTVLTQMQAVADGVLAASCPRSWGPFVLPDGALVTVQRYAHAPSVFAQLRTSFWPRRRAGQHFRRCAAWYGRFAAATRGPSQPFDDAALEEYVAAPLAALAGRYGPAVVPATALDRTLGAARALRGQPVPRVAEHGDLWPANLLLPARTGTLFVLDWEHFRPAVMPGFDLLLFCTTYAQNWPARPFGWTPAGPALDLAYVREGWASRQITRLLAHGSAASGLAPAFVPILLPVLLARMVLRQQESRDSDGARDPRVSGWLAALRAWWDRPPTTWLETWADQARPHA